MSNKVIDRIKRILSKNGYYFKRSQLRELLKNSQTMFGLGNLKVKTIYYNSEGVIIYSDSHGIVAIDYIKD